MKEKYRKGKGNNRLPNTNPEEEKVVWEIPIRISWKTFSATLHAMQILKQEKNKEPRDCQLKNCINQSKVISEPKKSFVCATCIFYETISSHGLFFIWRQFSIFYSDLETLRFHSAVSKTKELFLYSAIFQRRAVFQKIFSWVFSPFFVAFSPPIRPTNLCALKVQRYQPTGSIIFKTEM